MCACGGRGRGACVGVWMCDCLYCCWLICTRIQAPSQGYDGPYTMCTECRLDMRSRLLSSADMLHKPMEMFLARLALSPSISQIRSGVILRTISWMRRDFFPYGPVNPTGS